MLLLRVLPYLCHTFSPPAQMGLPARTYRMLRSLIAPALPATIAPHCFDAQPAAPSCAAAATSNPAPVLLDTMTTELQRAFTSLGKPGRRKTPKQLPPYFLSYSVSDAELRLHPRPVWRAGRQHSQPRARGRRAGAPGRLPSSTTPTARIAAPPSTACSCR